MDFGPIEIGTEGQDDINPESTDNPGRAAANSIGWFIFLSVVTFVVIIVSNRGIRDKVLAKIKGINTRLYRKPVNPDEET